MAQNSQQDVGEIQQFPLEENNIRRATKSTWVHNEDEYSSLQSEVVVHQEEEKFETSFIVSPIGESLAVVSTTKERQRRKSDLESSLVKSSTSIVSEIDLSNVISPRVLAYQKKKNVFQSPSMRSRISENDASSVNAQESCSPVNSINRVGKQSEHWSPSLKSTISVISETVCSNALSKTISSSDRERKSQFNDATSWKSNDYESDKSSHIKSNQSTSTTSHHLTELKTKHIYESTPQPSPKDFVSRGESTIPLEEEINKYTTCIGGLSFCEYIRPRIQIEEDDDVNKSKLSVRSKPGLTSTFDQLDNMVC